MTALLTPEQLRIVRAAGLDKLPEVPAVRIRQNGNGHGIEFLPFEEARKFVRSLGLKGGTEWRTWAKSGKRPLNIPASACTFYKGKWVNWGDWLGTGNLHNAELVFMPFEEARAIVRNLGLTNRAEYRVWANTSRDIPKRPDHFYEEWQGWGDWLGTGNVAPGDRIFLSFEEARAFVRTLKLRSKTAWIMWAKTDARSKDKIPASPSVTYSQEWEGWGDWLGTGNIKPGDRVFLSFEKARTFARGLGLKSKAEWTAWWSKKRPTDIPGSPNRYSEWKGYGDWLGTDNIKCVKKEYLPFEEARALVRRLELKSATTWRAWAQSDKRPKDKIPADPRRVYPEYAGMGDWLGTGKPKRAKRKK